MSFAANTSTKEAAQIQASAILTRLEQAKNKGQVRGDAALELLWSTVHLMLVHTMWFAAA